MLITLEFRFHIDSLCSSSFNTPPHDVVKNVEEGSDVCHNENDNHDDDHNLVVGLKTRARENSQVNEVTKD